MKVKILKNFPHARDGINVVDMIEGAVEDIEGAAIAGLEKLGLVSRDFDDDASKAVKPAPENKALTAAPENKAGVENPAPEPEPEPKPEPSKDSPAPGAEDRPENGATPKPAAPAPAKAPEGAQTAKK